MRTFVSIDIENSAILHAVQEIQSKIAQPGIKLVDPSIIHITLKFLGEIAPETVQQIEMILTQTAAKFSPFEITFKGFGAFPNLNRPRVVWIDIDTDSGRDNMISLAASIDQGTQSIGFPAEKRRFSSHLTIGRIKFAKPVLRNQLKDLSRDLASQVFGRMKVDKIRLKKSTLTPKGPIYETIAVVQLTPANTV